MDVLGFLKVLWPVLCFLADSSCAEPRTITAESGQDITLSCRAPDKNIPIIVVEWSRADLETEPVLLYRDDQLDPEQQHPSFKDRVDLQDHQMKDGDVSLVLKDVTAADAGTYECRVIQRETNRRKRANLKTEPISIIDLRVAPPGPTGGLSEGGGKKDGGKEDGGKEDGSVGLIVGVSVAAGLLLLLLAAVGFVIYRKLKQQSPDSRQPPDGQQGSEMSPLQSNSESAAAPNSVLPVNAENDG